jgi:IS1 family transposase
MRYPNGVVTTYGYDASSRLETLTAIHDDGTGPPTTITSFSYGYDDAGNRTSKTTLDYAESYGYDDLYRLTHATRTGAGANAWVYGYDDVGNRTTYQQGATLVSPVYNARNQLISTTTGGQLLVRGTLDEPGFAFVASQEMKDAGQAGDIWTWTALDAETKLIVSWLVGGRDAGYAHVFVQDLASRLATRAQVTTDGYKAYVEAIEGAFGADVDYAQLVKVYGEAPVTEKRYSPAKYNGSKKQIVSGDPDPAHISTSYVERQNLTMRMSMRRFTRLTNAFSKKVENLEAAGALYFMHYNFARIHSSLRVTPAMEAGVCNHVWTLGDIVGLLDA